MAVLTVNVLDQGIPAAQNPKHISVSVSQELTLRSTLRSAPIPHSVDIGGLTNLIVSKMKYGKKKTGWSNRKEVFDGVSGFFQPIYTNSSRDFDDKDK